MLKKLWMGFVEFAGGVLIATTLAIAFAVLGAMAIEPHQRSKKKH